MAATGLYDPFTLSELWQLYRRMDAAEQCARIAYFDAVVRKKSSRIRLRQRRMAVELDALATEVWRAGYKKRVASLRASAEWPLPEWPL